MDDLLSQDEINALLSGGALGEDSGSGLSMEDSQLLDEVASIFSNAENSVFGMLSGKDVDTALESAEVLSQKDFLEKLPEAPFVFRATCGGFDDIPLTLVVEQQGALMLADLMMGGEGRELPEEPSDLYLNAAQEGLSQVVGASFTSLSGLLGGRRLMPENTTSSLAHEPYSYSKTLAEQEAWRLAAGQERWDLVVINPAFILGPALGPAPTSESFTVVRMLIDGTTRMGAPRVGLSAVDVREVAGAHIAAAFTPKAHGRYILSAEDTDIVSLGRRLLPRYGRALPLPRRAAPKALLLALAPRLGMTRAYVKRNVGFAVRSDAARSRAELGIRYRPIQASLEEMVEQMQQMQPREAPGA